MNITIIIPYFKLSFFDATLNSLAIQTDKRFRVLIGDDASLEDPKPLLDTYKGQFDFFYHRFDENLGSISLVQQWERCVKIIDFDSSWILILGDDDVLGINVIQEFYKNLELINKLNINVIKFSTVVIDENDKEITKVFKNKELTKSTDAFYNKIIDRSRSSLSEHIFRKSTYDELGFKEYGLAWHSDDMAWLDFSNFKKLFCINTEKIFIRVSDKSISGTNEDSIEKVQASFQFYSDLVNKHLFKFSFSQRNLIIRIFESKVIFLKGKSFTNYIKIVSLFAKNAFFISIIRFTIRFIFKNRKNKCL